jgi:hypothetical protein
VDPVTRAAELPTCSLLGRRVEQAWIPREGNRDPPSVGEIDAHRVLVEVNVEDALAG